MYKNLFEIQEKNCGEMKLPSNKHFQDKDYQIVWRDTNKLICFLHIYRFVQYLCNDPIKKNTIDDFLIKYLP
jgi:hypothetical protein